MRARIFQRPKTAMQSGVAGTENWVLDFVPTRPEVNDPLMGWWGRGDTRGQVPYDVELPPAPVKHKPKAYADNFRYGRSENWTH
jgi:hypothetical protein